MADIKALTSSKGKPPTKPAASVKGKPPKIETAPGNTKKPLRDVKEPTKPLQLMVPESVFDAFSAQAGQEFGFSKGSKKALFLKMWSQYHESH